MNVLTITETAVNTQTAPTVMEALPVLVMMAIPATASTAQVLLFSILPFFVNFNCL